MNFAEFLNLVVKGDMDTVQSGLPNTGHGEDGKLTLAPCPFCNSDTALHLVTPDELHECDSGNDSDVAVICDYHMRGCGATGGFRQTEEEAIALWNSRPNMMIFNMVNPVSQ